MARVELITDSPTGFGGSRTLSFDFSRIIENVAGISWWNEDETIMTMIPYSKIHQVRIIKE